MWIHYNWLNAGEQRSSKLSSIILKYIKIKSLLETKPNYVNDMQDLHNIQDVQGPSDSRANHRMPHRYLRALGCRRDSAPSAAWKNGSIIEIWAESAENALWRLVTPCGIWPTDWGLEMGIGQSILISSFSSLISLSLWGNNGNHKGTGSTESCPANLGQGMFWHVTRSLGFVDIGVASGAALYINSWHQLVSVYLYVKSHQQFDDLIRSAPNKSSGGLATSAAGACGDKLIKREGLEGLAAGGAGRLTRASHDRRPLNSIANAIEGMLTHNSHDGLSTHLKIDVKTMWKSCPISK